MGCFGLVMWDRHMQRVLCSWDSPGKSVNVRNADSKKGKILFTAHRGDRFPFLAVAPSGWYEIDTKKGQGFITSLPRYTKLIECPSDE